MGTRDEAEPIAEFSSATVWYREENEVVRSENSRVVLFDGWVRVNGTLWLPRERIESINNI